MKKIITCVLIAFTITLVNPLFAQTKEELQQQRAKIEAQIQSKKKEQTEANEKKKTSTTDADDKQYGDLYNKLQKEINDLYRQRDTIDNKIAAATKAEPVNNDPSPQIVDGEEVNDTASMVEAATDSTEVVEDAGTKDAEKSSFPWWIYLLMFVLPVLCSGVVYFILNSKIEELKMRFKADSQASQRELNQRLNNLADKTNRIESSVGSVRQDMRNRDRVIEQRPPVSPYGAPAQPVQPKRPTEFYLSMPSPDGSWSEVSTVNTQGQCLYILNSPDGVNGAFRVINEPIAIQMILMGVGKYLNPVCRVSNTASQVSGIVTDEPGTAVFENGVWRMTKKAVVHYV